MMMSLGGSVGGLDHPLQHTPHTHLLLLHTLPALSWCVLRSRTPFHPSVRSRVHTTSSTRVKLEPRQQNQAGKGTLHTGSPGEGGGGKRGSTQERTALGPVQRERDISWQLHGACFHQKADKTNTNTRQCLAFKESRIRLKLPASHSPLSLPLSLASRPWLEDF